MPQPLRFASFNVENLFSRAKVINLQDHSVASDALALIGELQALLKEASYTAAIKSRIIARYNDVKTYISIREDRERLFNKPKTKVVASGAADWDGVIEFRRSKISENARVNTARVVKEVKADVACIVEAEDLTILREFNRQMLGARKFACEMLIDGNDQRGIDVALLSKFPIARLRTHQFEKAGPTPLFPRDCLEAELTLDDGRPLFVLCNHFTSKSQGQASSDAKRKRQAERVAQILKEYDLKKDRVVVAGDFNDTPDRAPLQSLLATPNLFDALALQFPQQPEPRWTYFYEQKTQIDFVLVSKPLRDAFVAAGVERRGIHGLDRITGGAETQFPTVTSTSDAASDHGAVWAEFSL